MKIYIAPMAGITDYSYRKILEGFAPDMLFTEMVNAKLLAENDRVTERELLKCDDRHLTATQVFGGNYDEIVYSFLKLENMGFNKINLNMACPQPKIIKNKAGAALLPQVEFVDSLFSELKKKLSRQTEISIKIRIGYKDFSSPEVYLAMADKYNLDFICVHGRRQEEMYRGKADWKTVRNLSLIKRKTKFIGNGDLFEAENIPYIIKNTNLDGIMLARGIIGNPWLISQTREILKTGKIQTFTSFNEIKELLLRHLKLLKENKGEVTASMEINKFIRAYFKNFRNGDMDRLLSEIILEKNYKKKIKAVSSL